MNLSFCEDTDNFHRMKVKMESAEANVEYCERCKEVFIFKKSKHGRIDNEYYREVHARDYIQPDNKLFTREYGEV